MANLRRALTVQEKEEQCREVTLRIITVNQCPEKQTRIENGMQEGGEYNQKKRNRTNCFKYFATMIASNLDYSQCSFENA
jgi:hypothetical protein